MRELMSGEARGTMSTDERGNVRRVRGVATNVRRIGRIAVGVALLLATLARSMTAQTLRGTVHDSASHEPIPGAVVMLLDSSGTVSSRSITDERGQYRLSLSNHARSVRVVRIGFQPREANLPSAWDRSAPIDLTMMPFGTTLATIRVTEKSRCPRRSDAAAAEALWEQARAGLLATVVAREANPATLHRLGFVRTMDGNSGHIARFVVASDSVSGVDKSFFAASSAASFVKSGFERDSAGKRTLFAPDADVLLDDAFADGYCLRVADPSRARPREVGLGFGAAEHPEGRVDIDGTLWIDTAARVIRDIEFRYVGLPAWTDAFRPGGEVSFRQMTNGVVLIDRWYLRNVAVKNDTIRDLALRNGDDRTTVDRPFAVENGGEVAHATWPDGPTWHAALGEVQIHLTAARGQPSAGTVVALAGTPYRATADASGNIVIGDLLPGPYSVDVLEPRLARLGLAIPAPLTFFAARDSTLRFSMALPTAEEYVRGRCAAAAKRSGVGDSVFIVGRVSTPDGKPIADARVTTAIKQRTEVWSWENGAYLTGTDGVFQVCTRDLHLNASVLLRVEITSPHAPLNRVETTRTLSTNLTIVPIVVNVATQTGGRSPSGEAP